MGISILGASLSLISRRASRYWRGRSAPTVGRGYVVLWCIAFEQGKLSLGAGPFPQRMRTLVGPPDLAMLAVALCNHHRQANEWLWRVG
jgi:hypothetical protein